MVFILHCNDWWIFLPYTYSRQYVYCFVYIFPLVLLFKTLCLFRNLEYIAQKLWSSYSIGTTEIWPGACYLLAAWWQNLRPVITYCRSYGFRRHNAVPPKGSFNNYVEQILPNFNQLPPSNGHLWTYYLLFFTCQAWTFYSPPAYLVLST